MITLDRPKTMLTMPAPLRAKLFGPLEYARLEACAQILPDSHAAPGALADAELLITGWGSPPLKVADLAHMSRLRGIIHSAGSVKWLLPEQVWEQRIAVSTAAAANAVPVAEFALAAILMAGKNAIWTARHYGIGTDMPPAMDLSAPHGNFGRTVGIIGASRVGRAVIELLRPFDFYLQLYDPFMTSKQADALGVQLCSLPQLLETSSIVSLHAPATATTTHMIGETELALLPDQATLVNTARSQLIDQAALVGQLRRGRIRAILDVTDPEVLAPDHPLRHLPNVFLTPHIAGAQGNEVRRLGQCAIAEAEQFAAGEPFRYPVTREMLHTMA